MHQMFHPTSLLYQYTWAGQRSCHGDIVVISVITITQKPLRL